MSTQLEHAWNAALAAYEQEREPKAGLSVLQYHFERAKDYWHRQGREDGAQCERDVATGWLLSHGPFEVRNLHDVADELLRGSHIQWTCRQRKPPP